MLARPKRTQHNASTSALDLALNWHSGKSCASERLLLDKSMHSNAPAHWSGPSCGSEICVAQEDVQLIARETATTLRHNHINSDSHGFFVPSGADVDASVEKGAPSGTCAASPGLGAIPLAHFCVMAGDHFDKLRKTREEFPDATLLATEACYESQQHLVIPTYMLLHATTCYYMLLHATGIYWISPFLNYPVPLLGVLLFYSLKLLETA